MDQIKIKRLEVFAHHGVLEEETREGQKFYVSVTLFLDTRQAGLVDDLTKSVHYGEVSYLITDLMQSNTFYLIETVAEFLAEKILLSFPLVQELELEVSKPMAPIGLPFEDVSVTVKRGWKEAYLSFGSNMGNREQSLQKALDTIGKNSKCRIQTISEFLITKPYGDVDQEDFLNGVMKIQTLYTPFELLEFLQKIEKEGGRERLRHWGPRTIDLDILFYEQLVISNEKLIVPHVDLKNREFVLKPMVQIAPYHVHPVFHKTMTVLLGELIGNQ